MAQVLKGFEMCSLFKKIFFYMLVMLCANNELLHAAENTSFYGWVKKNPVAAATIGTLTAISIGTSFWAIRVKAGLAQREADFRRAVAQSQANLREASARQKEQLFQEVSTLLKENHEEREISCQGAMVAAELFMSRESEEQFHQKSRVPKAKLPDIKVDVRKHEELINDLCGQLQNCNEGCGNAHITRQLQIQGNKGVCGI